LLVFYSIIFDIFTYSFLASSTFFFFLLYNNKRRNSMNKNCIKCGTVKNVNFDGMCKECYEK